MRIPIYKIGGIRFFLVFLLSAASLAMSLTSCVSDNDANSKSISDYTDANVRSYGDLFEIFWRVMNQRYCDLNEQAGVSSLSWEQVYEMYKPKFEALKTFKPSSEAVFPGNHESDYRPAFLRENHPSGFPFIHRNGSV